MRTNAAIDPGVSVAVKASAGSGKTFTLSLRYVNLLLHGVDPGSILCITFTNKATNEMYKRILSLLRYLALELSPSAMNDEARCLLAMRGESRAKAPEEPGRPPLSEADRIGELR
ncbi:MAG: UvrD-helicase domain-containing protein, partial [Thermodesulfovibrionales bacterium]